MEPALQLSAKERPFDTSYELDWRYGDNSERVFLTGIQALVRLPLVQRRIDRQNGLNTAGFISGYRGSPLAAYDRSLWQAQSWLDAEDIRFLPAVNEDMAATAIIGTQEVENDANATVDGVFAIWYGKGPGVDRSLDALKHANALGTSKHGGVLLVFGDDHGCISSAMPHQSEQALMSLPMPVLNPASVDEYVSYGLYGIALSRFSGAWVGFKTASETVESGRSLAVDETVWWSDPEDYQYPEIGLHNQWPNSVGVVLEKRSFHKYWAIQAFIEKNPLDRMVYSAKKPRLGIVTTGKAHLDVMGALERFGIGASQADEMGICLRKIGLSYPLARNAIAEFASGLEQIIVIEEKRSFVELQLRDILYNLPADKRPVILGKDDKDGNPFIPKDGELSPSLLMPFLGKTMEAMGMTTPATEALVNSKTSAPAEFEIGQRTPYFCSGCPHNTSTVVPEGSVAMAGVGCHVMASWMDRNTRGLIHMGGEGANWVGRAPFTGNGHIFQNMGDGTYFHSGLVAIRQAVASGVNMTYKILFNGAVGMTGGQPMDGDLTPESIARQLRAEGIQRIALVSDEISRFDKNDLPGGTTLHDRREMESLQKELRKVKGVSVLIYEQMCAAEKRRLRKRNAYPDPDKYVFINEHVCEGCGDCALVSNCLSIVPKHTEFGVKRTIDQSTCNKDFSCLNGFCPALVTVEGKLLKTQNVDNSHVAELVDKAQKLDHPHYQSSENHANLVVVGIGGTGIVTIGAVLTMAAHLEGKGASSLDFMGLAQKGGSVISHVKLFSNPDHLEPARIDMKTADVVLVCDSVVATGGEALSMLSPTRSRLVVNLNTASTADFILRGAASLETTARLQTLKDNALDIETVNAGDIASQLFGNSVFANMIVLGMAWQAGLLPVGRQAIMRAIELNGIAIENNRQAFEVGRTIAGDPEWVGKVNDTTHGNDRGLNEIVERATACLGDYQSNRYALQYETFLDTVKSHPSQTDAISIAVARNLFKLMAYKDEYEVARLFVDNDFVDRLKGRFEPSAKVHFHLAPWPFIWGKDDMGQPRKRQVGPWMLKAMKLLNKAKFLRGTTLDIFGYQKERKIERRLIGDYKNMVLDTLNKATPENTALVAELLNAPAEIAGFGPVKAKSIDAYSRRVQVLQKKIARGSKLLH